MMIVARRKIAPYKVTELPNQRQLVCPKCGVDSACQCGVPPITRAEYAVRQHPEKSDRAIADAIGVGSNTVRRARQKTTAPDGAVQTRVGRDGKARKQPKAHDRTARCAKELGVKKIRPHETPRPTTCGKLDVIFPDDPEI